MEFYTEISKISNIQPNINTKNIKLSKKARHGSTHTVGLLLNLTYMKFKNRYFSSMDIEIRRVVVSLWRWMLTGKRYEENSWSDKDVLYLDLVMVQMYN